MNILDYIKGPKRGKAAHEFETNLMRDPFLAEAMEGYEKVKGDHEQIIAKLRNRVDKKAKRKKLSLPKFIWSGVAASVIILGFIAVYFLGGFHLIKPTKNGNPAPPLAEVSPVADSTTQEATQLTPSENKEAAISARQASPMATKQLYGQVQKSQSPKNKTDNNSTYPEPKNLTANSPQSQKTDTTTHYVLEKRAPANVQPEEISILVEGIVKDEKGNPLLGVKVKTSDNSIDSYTNESGKFSVKVIHPGQMIEFMYLGFETLEMPTPVALNQPLIVIMKEHKDLLGEQEIISKDKWQKPSSGKSSEEVKPTIGFKAYANYVKSKRMNPDTEECREKKGKVRVCFSTDEEGRPFNIRVVHGLCPEADQQAIRLINTGPSWTANGENIEYEISFK